MIKKFRFTVELKAQVHDSPKGVGQQEIFERVRRLGQNMTDDENALLEMYKAIFFDLIFGDYYSDEIRQSTNVKSEAELLKPVAQKMASRDSEFFNRLLMMSEEDSGIDKDNVLSLFYSQFENPEVIDVCFEIITD